MTEFADFPALQSAFAEGHRRGLHTGLQIYVSRDGQPLLDSALGEATAGRPLTRMHLMPWRSAGKPVTALLLLKVFAERGLSLQTPISHWLPEADPGYTATVFDLLTHQAGFAQTDTGWPHRDWDQSLRQILNTPPAQAVGQAAYHPQSSWFVLGEILRRISSAVSGPMRSFSDVLTTELLQPLQMDQTYCGLPADVLLSQSDLLPQLYDRDKGQLVPSCYSTLPWLTQPSPGGNLRGPVRDLGRFFELLFRRGRLENGAIFVAESVIDSMTRRHRVGMFDETLQHHVDFGLGVLCDSNHYGADTVPYGFGRFCSDRTFGHGGSQCSMAFCDPAAQLVVVWSANGFCGEGQHQRRNRMLNEAIYTDLQL